MTHSLLCPPNTETLKICRENIKVSDIVLLRGNGNYTNIHLVCGRVILSSKHLGYFEEKLLGSFFQRPHKQVIINLNFIAARHSVSLLMQNGEEVRVSRRRKI